MINTLDEDIPFMIWGKYRDKRMDTMSNSYISWFLDTVDSIDHEEAYSLVEVEEQRRHGNAS